MSGKLSALTLQNSELQEKILENHELQEAQAEIEKLRQNLNLERRQSQAQLEALEGEVKVLKNSSLQEEYTSNLSCCRHNFIHKMHCFLPELEERLAELKEELKEARTVKVMNGGIMSCIVIRQTFIIICR